MPNLRLFTALTIVCAFAVQAQRMPASPKSGTALANSEGFTFLRAKSLDSGGQLAWVLAVADLNGDGRPDLVSVNLAGESNGDGSVGVLLGSGNGNFRKAITYDSGGGGPAGIAVSDLNGDGKPDLVVANQGCLNIMNGCLGVLLGNGDGTFQQVVIYSSGGRSWASVPALSTPIMIADVNNDGRADLIVINQTNQNQSGDGQVGVLLGNGDGTFQPVVTFDTGAFGAFTGFLTDVNGDGKADIVALNCSPGGSSDCSHNSTVGVLPGNGDGTFRGVTTYDSGVLGGTSALAVADVNGDGKPDIVVGGNPPCSPVCSSGSFGVLLGRGDGTFQPVVTYDLGGVNAAESIAVADLNKDGKTDLIVAGGAVGVWLGKGDGTFQLSNIYSNTGGTSQVFVSDLDNDGNLDLVGINTTSSAADVRLGSGDGTFQSIQTFKLGGTQNSWGTIADLNGDGRPDLVSANWCSLSCRSEEGTVGVLLNVASNPNTTTTTLASSLNPSIYGQRVMFSTTVTNSSGTIPTGQVSFSWSGHTLGVASLNGSGVATLTKPYLNAGSYPVTAVYKGDTNNLGSVSSTMNQVVQQTTTSAMLTTTPNPSTQGQAVTFTATISSPTVTPTGPVTFTAGKTVLGAAQLSGGKAKLTISSLPVGTPTVTATYYGDSNIAKSSVSVTQTVR